jgi:uncharacterized membrane protein YphA (DoxX/SURF4 family)
VRLARVSYFACLFSFGLVHFVFVDATAALVHKWLAPHPKFWAYATGIADWLAALAILSGHYALLAARLLKVMFTTFGVLIHLPALVAEPRSHMSWTANVMNLALVGSAWLLADWLKTRQPRPQVYALRQRASHSRTCSRPIATGFSRWSDGRASAAGRSADAEKRREHRPTAHATTIG